MGLVLELKTGELAIGKDGDVFRTGSVGSCLVIALYDKEKRIGGLAHSMLPQGQSVFVNGTPDLSPGNMSGKYVNEAIDTIIAAMRAAGADQQKIYARLVGGASMFKRLTGDKFGIGFQNISAAHAHLSNIHIPIENEDTGGTSGKAVEFDLRTGILKINTVI